MLHIPTLSRRSLGASAFAFLTFILCLALGPLQAASLYDTKCGSLSGTEVSDAAVEVLNVEVDRHTTTPPANDTRRREHVEISGGLASALGLTTADVGTGGESAQIRVTLEAANPDTGLIPSANFTVAAIDTTESGNWLRVWLPDDLKANGDFSDDDNGYFKLFGSQKPATVFKSTQEATVYRVAPSTTVVVTDGAVTEYEHFDEANTGSKYFRECVEVRGGTLAVLAPHGGGIETKISGELDTLLSEFERLGQEPSVWEGYGQWGSGETYERWHITSTQISEGSFPGFEDLAASGTYDYALSLHGFSDAEVAVIFGGQASRQDKCYLVATLEERLELSNLGGEITYRVFGPDGDPVDIVRDSDGSGDNPQALSGVDHLDGDSDDNVVNRISPNPNGVRGFGGIQVELSDDLRTDASLFPEFMAALAFAMDELIRLDPQGDDCQQYE